MGLITGLVIGLVYFCPGRNPIGARLHGEKNEQPVPRRGKILINN